MKIIDLINRLEKYTNIPRLSFLFEKDEYIYMADVVDKINYIFKNIEIIEIGKQGLKKYKDDPETIENIKNNNKYYENIIEESLQELEEIYTEHKYKQNAISNYEEDSNERI